LEFTALAGASGRRLFLVLLLAAVAGCSTAASDARNPQGPTEPLDVVLHDGKVRHFKVEVVDDDDSRERGLMFRMSLAPNAGMLFDFKTPQDVSFWMKNTYIPLDIIFVGRDGHILNIARQARPMDETNLPSAGPALGVLEIRGGRAAELGVEPGDLVRHRIFH
jgi:uncharacterized membrane protein (UPF0127 family)